MPHFDHFKLAAPIYDCVFKYHRSERLNQLLALPGCSALLDACGGTGRIAQEFSSQAFPVVIADLSLAMLRQAANKSGLNPVNSQIERLPFASGSFSRIIMVDALHHVIDQEKTAKELWRVLAEGGRIIIEEPDISRLEVKIVALLERLALMRSHFKNPEEIAGLFWATPAQITIQKDRASAWVVVEKPG